MTKNPTSHHRPRVVSASARLTRQQQKLVEKYLLLVYKIAGGVYRRIPRGTFEREDLVSEGYLGLINAVMHFDEVHGVPFKVYATIRIRGTIIDAIRKITPWLGGGAVRTIGRIERAQAQGLKTDKEIGDAIGIGEGRMRRIRARLATTQLSLSTPVAEMRFKSGAQKITLGDTLPSPEAYERERTKGQMCATVEKITTRYGGVVEKEHFEIFLARFLEERTLGNIGIEHGLTESRICQIVKGVTKELRAALERDGIESLEDLFES